MRVLMLTSVLPRFRGDATPAFVLNQARELASRGVEVVVLAPWGEGAAWQETVDGVRIVRFPYVWPLRYSKLCYEGGMLINFRSRPWTKLLLPFFAIAEFMTTVWAIRRFKPDLLHTHSLLPQGWIGVIASSLFDLPHVTTAHGNDVFGLKKTGLMGSLKRWTLARADAITVNSRATEQAVLELGADLGKVSLVRAAPNTHSPKSASKNRIRAKIGERRFPTLCFVGRMIEEKGVGDLLDAVRLLLEAFPDLRLCAVGDGQALSGFQRRAGELGVESAVFWAGWRPPEEISAWMAESDLVVVPSREMPTGWTEAQGLVIVEAMLAGVPVVASSIGGIVDMLADGSTGFLAPHSNPSALAKVIEAALGDRKNLDTVARVAGEWANEHLAPARVAARTIEVYESIL